MKREILQEGEFWLMNEKGDMVLRDLKSEAESFKLDAYYRGEFDAFNYCWYENFDLYEWDANGCDYERKGCSIQPGDVVLDVGGNVGVFARRAHSRGASRVISLEPLSPTYKCLEMNAPSTNETYNFGLAGNTCFPEFEIHTNYTRLGGGSSLDVNSGREIIYSQKSLCLDVNSFFESGLFEKVDFMKVDIEGGEYSLFESIKDEHLSKMRCVAMELHPIGEKIDQFQEFMGKRMDSLGFDSFCLFYGGNMRTLSYWKR
jgi:FkbM family methyltransferase